MATNKDYKQQNKDATLGKGKDEQHGSGKSGQNQMGGKKEELGKKGSSLGQKDHLKKGQQGGFSQQQKSGQQQQGGFDKQGQGKIGDMDKDKKGGRKL